MPSAISHNSLYRNYLSLLPLYAVRCTLNAFFMIFRQKRASPRLYIEACLFSSDEPRLRHFENFDFCVLALDFTLYTLNYDVHSTYESRGTSHETRTLICALKTVTKRDKKGQNRTAFFVFCGLESWVWRLRTSLNFLAVHLFSVYKYREAEPVGFSH